MSTDSRSPRAKRSSTNDAEAFAKGRVETSAESPRLERSAEEKSADAYNAPYEDGGGIYSKPRRGPDG
jgi:hypothetical protein